MRNEKRGKQVRGKERVKTESKEQQASCFFNENNKKRQGLRAVKGYKSTF